MRTENLGPLINDLCRTAGQKIGIEFRSPPPLGAQVSGRWELGYQPKGLSWGATFTYWLSPDSYLRESVIGLSDSKPNNRTARRSAPALTRNLRKCSNGFSPCKTGIMKGTPKH